MFALALLKPFLPQIIGGAIVLAVAGGGIAWWSNHQYNKGWNAALAAVAAQDRKAGEDAQTARDRVRACRSSGGVWDIASGECVRG